ncbi:MAG: folate family ECF transporter S component [Lachnospiraceae bacterium]|nr:folate family ECF transporter S component [Lachnospiraceae bacterium]MBQ3163447.1 folate family ECF transporter S component [Lachnospiraceae bacterium]MBQ6993026.1 folate family ECF transporter S component [Lachnospiraceae bacterium]MEE1255345.1 folate family ECF transporter S component [Lachnospiraceae bacterium]
MSNLKNVKTLTLSGMFIALSVVCGFLNLPITQFIEIRFGSLMLAVSGMLLGPAISAVIGALSDIIAFMVKPTGPFFPGFTISAAVSGIIFGFMLHKKELTIWRIFLAECIHTFVVGFILNSLWLSILYNNAFIAVVSSRAVKELIMLPINTILLTMIIKSTSKAINRKVIAS